MTKFVADLVNESGGFGVGSGWGRGGGMGRKKDVQVFREKTGLNKNGIFQNSNPSTGRGVARWCQWLSNKTSSLNLMLWATREMGLS